MKGKLESFYVKMSLAGEEQEEIHVEQNLMKNAVLRGENCLIMILLTSKHYNREAFKQIMKKIWRLVKTIRFRD